MQLNELGQFITLNVYIRVGLQHDASETARRAGQSATAYTCFNQAQCVYRTRVSNATVADFIKSLKICGQHRSIIH